MTSEEAYQSVLSLAGDIPTPCGYCLSKAKTSHTYYAILMQLTCPADTPRSLQTYQKLLDRGWSRSGNLLYKPDMSITCCPQYTIRLPASDFLPSRNQRKCINRFNRFIISGLNEHAVSNDSPKAKLPSFNLVSAVHASETSLLPPGVTPAHTFEVTLEPASFTDEKFAVYCDYHMNVHKEQKDDPNAFSEFLCDRVLVASPIPYPSIPPSYLPPHYGTYHQLYRIDGELVAVGVLDILPSCVLSGYFIHLGKWSWCELGKLSALREIALVQEIRDAGMENMKWFYMGYYVHSSSKMRYKGGYVPSELLDPESYTWYPLSKCISILSGYRYAVFSAPETSSNDEVSSEGPVANVLEVLSPSPDVLANVKARLGSANDFTISSVAQLHIWQDREFRRSILRAIETLGAELAQEILFSFSNHSSLASTSDVE